MNSPLVIVSPAGARLEVLDLSETPKLRKTGAWVRVVSAPPESRFKVGEIEHLHLPAAALRTVTN